MSLYQLRIAQFLGIISRECRIIVAGSCNNPASSPSSTSTTTDKEESDWATSKTSQSPVCALTSEYQTPQALSLGNLAWEDGIYVSRDGLNLYSTYIPMDALSSSLAGALPTQFYLYERGTQIGQDFSDPPAFATLGHPWLHADIAISQRSSTSQDFSAWQLSGLHGQYYNIGAAQGIQNTSDPTKYDYFFYTNDTPGCTKIYLTKSVGMNPSTAGSAINITGDQSAYRQDNPHCENVDGTLVLFFESDDTRKGGKGAQDIWYTISADQGATWSTPVNVDTVNTSGYDGQPHLYYDGTTWWLYCTQTNTDGKLAIFRYGQGTGGDWNSWTNKTLVVSAGTTMGVGEPSLTSSGDLYFVVIFKKTVDPTSYDLYDADPWVMKKR
jgi:hypothetical protein